jgi:hypothetical protein
MARCSWRGSRPPTPPSRSGHPPPACPDLVGGPQVIGSITRQVRAERTAPGGFRVSWRKGWRSVRISGGSLGHRHRGHRSPRRSGPGDRVQDDREHVQVDEDGRAEEHRLLWSQPTTISQLGELTAQWPEGTITYQPGCFASAPDPETADPIEVLAAVNRAGLFTTFSQPGIPRQAAARNAPHWKVSAPNTSRTAYGSRPSTLTCRCIVTSINEAMRSRTSVLRQEFDQDMRRGGRGSRLRPWSRRRAGDPRSMP